MRHHLHRPARGDPPYTKTWRAATVFLVVCTFGALMPVSAHASTTTDGETETNPVVASYAAEYSVTLVEAQQRLERIPELQEIVEALHASESERLAGWGIDHHGSMTAWVWLTGAEPPTSAALAIANLHDDVQIRTGAQVTFAALASAQDQFGLGVGIGAVGSTGAVGGNRIDLSNMITHTAVDLSANALEIGIEVTAASPRPSGALDPADDQAPIGPLGNTDDVNNSDATLAYVMQLIAPHVSVPFNVIEADFVEDHAAFEGGRRMTNGGAVCTSGFTAYHSGDNRYGLITAGHCDQSTWTTQGVTLDFKVRAYNASNDAAFYMIPQGQGHSVTNRVRCSDNSGTTQTCPINSVGPGRLFMQGHYVCHMGTNSGVSCGTVDNVRYKPNPPRGCDGNGTECRPVFIRASGPDMRACSGDSGGPVYSYSAAYGIHKGGPRNNPCNRDNSYIVFSGIRRVQNVLGVAVVTNWPSSVP